MQSESALFFLNVVRAEFNHCVTPGHHHCQIVRQITAICANQNVALMVNAQIVLPTRKWKIEACLSIFQIIKKPFLQHWRWNSKDVVLLQKKKSNFLETGQDDIFYWFCSCISPIQVRNWFFFFDSFVNKYYNCSFMLYTLQESKPLRFQCRSI